MTDTSCNGLSLVFLDKKLWEEVGVFQLWLLVVSSVLNSDGPNIQ